MSYSLHAPCGTCKKMERCTDRHVIQGAIDTIHQMPCGVDFGHQGYGMVKLDCGEATEPTVISSSDVDEGTTDGS